MATVKYLVIYCDECKHEFKFKPKIIKVKVFKDSGVERHYFQCPKCKHSYLVVYKDQEFKDNVKEMEIIHQKASELRENDPRYERLMDQHSRLHQRNLQISEGYKRVYGS